jgi:precorrin-6B methylase 2
MKDDQHKENDPLGEALLDYFKNPSEQKVITVKSPDFDNDTIPVSYFFRKYNQMPELEQQALQMCGEKVLDAGAGAGCHAMILQNQGKDVTALESSPGAAEVLKQRGIEKSIQKDIYEYTDERYDTILLLMNGIGLAGTPSGAKQLFVHLKSLLHSRGNILVDSSDLTYLYKEQHSIANIQRHLDDNYYGIVEFQMEYKHASGKPFKWLYLDEESFCSLAEDAGYQSEVVFKDHHYGFLAQLTIKQ